MNMLRSYLLDDNSYMKDFRRDVHNIIDWGSASKRVEKLEAMVGKIVKKEAKEAKEAKDA